MAKGPTRTDYEDTASPGLVRLIFLAMGIAMLVGLVAGTAWTLYHLVWRRWLG